MNWIPLISYTEIGTGTSKNFTLDSQPEGDPHNEVLKPVTKKSRSSNGTTQTQFNYTMQEYSLKFRFQSLALVTKFKDFLENHAYLGGNFNYFPSSDESASEVFELVTKSVKFSRPIPDDSDDFFYNFDFKIERVLDFTYDLEADLDIVQTQATIANNQSVAANITGLSFDGTETRGAEIRYSVYRNTTDAGATELSETGVIRVTYKTVDGSWEIDRESTGDAGLLTVTITAAGQLQYTSSNMTGSNYVGTIRFEASTIDLED